MPDAIEELLYGPPGLPTKSRSQSVISAYTTRLTTLSLSSLTTTEPAALSHDHQSLTRSLQALTKRTYKSINASSASLSNLRHALPTVATTVSHLQSSLPIVESRAVAFSEKYAKPSENPVLERRRRVTRLEESIDKVTNVLELPTLLQSTIAASSGGAGAATATSSSSSSSANASYAQALDLHAHIKRLQRLYPDSAIVASIARQAEEAMQGMTTRLLTSLRSPNLKLAGAMRLIGLLRRVAPELEDDSSSSTWSSTASEGSLGLLFLVSRLSNLTTTLDALEPLRDLADQETTARLANSNQKTDAWAAGQQTERYLKRYIEVFREQCFAIVSMHKSIFPSSLAGPTASASDADDILSPMKSPTSARQPHFPSTDLPDDAMQRLPSALSTFAFELVDTLMDTLRAYLPNVRDHGSRDSLLTQVLYCAGSLGRLGGDFSLMLAVLNEEMEEVPGAKPERENEWIEVTKRHRVQAGRLELLASGVGSGKAGKEVTSPA